MTTAEVETIACSSYRDHRARHRWIADRWICEACDDRAVASAGASTARAPVPSIDERPVGPGRPRRVDVINVRPDSAGSLGLWSSARPADPSSADPRDAASPAAVSDRRIVEPIDPADPLEFVVDEAEVAAAQTIRAWRTTRRAELEATP